jgi:hypothetical protein
MSILHNQNLKDNFILQVVDGDDIVNTYRYPGYCQSCMTESTTYKYTRFYTFCKNLRLLRIIKYDTVYLRALIWRAYDKHNRKIHIVDRVYEFRTSTFNRDTYKHTIIRPTQAFFDKNWKRFADIRKGSLDLDDLRINVSPNKMRTYPYMDTFIFAPEKINYLYNKCRPAVMWWLRSTEGKKRTMLEYGRRYTDE